MTNFDRYLSDINPEMLQDISRKRKRKELIRDVLGGFLLFTMLCAFSYVVLVS